MIPPALHVNLADSPGHIRTGWLSGESMAILALVGAVGYGAVWVPHVIVPDLYSGITEKVWNYFCFALHTKLVLLIECNFRT